MVTTHESSNRPNLKNSKTIKIKQMCTPARRAASPPFVHFMFMMNGVHGPRCERQKQTSKVKKY